MLAKRTGLEFDSGRLREDIRRLLRTWHWAGRYPLDDDAQFNQVLDEVVAYYTGDDVFVMSNYDLDGAALPGQTVGEALLSAYPGRIKTSHELTGGRAGPVRGPEEAAMGYAAMVKPVGELAGGWRSADPAAHPKNYSDPGQQVPGPPGLELRHVHLQVGQGAPGRPDDGGGEPRGRDRRARTRHAGPAGDARARAVGAVPGNADGPGRGAMQNLAGEELMHTTFAFATGFRFEPDWRIAHGGFTASRNMIAHVHGALDLTDLDELIINWSASQIVGRCCVPGQPARPRAGDAGAAGWLVAEVQETQDTAVGATPGRATQRRGSRIPLIRLGAAPGYLYDPYPKLYVVLRGRTVKGLLDGAEQLPDELVGRGGQAGPAGPGPPGEIVLRVAGPGPWSGTQQSAQDFGNGVVAAALRAGASGLQVLATKFYVPRLGRARRTKETRSAGVPLTDLARGMTRLSDLTRVKRQPVEGAAGKHYTDGNGQPWYVVAAQSENRLHAEAMVLLASLRREAGEEGLPGGAALSRGKRPAVTGVVIQASDPCVLAAELELSLVAAGLWSPRASRR